MQRWQDLYFIKQPGDTIKQPGITPACLTSCDPGRSTRSLLLQPGVTPARIKQPGVTPARYETTRSYSCLFDTTRSKVTPTRYETTRSYFCSFAFSFSLTAPRALSIEASLLSQYLCPKCALKIVVEFQRNFVCQLNYQKFII
jgi:hypothetical protein